MNAVNLLPVYRIRAAKRRQTLMLWTATIVGYTAALVCACAAIKSAYVVDRSPSRVLSSLQADLATDKEKLHILQSECRRLESRMKAAALASDHPDWSIVLALIAGGRTDGIKLDSVALSPVGTETRGAIFRIAGVGRTRADVNDFVGNIEDLSLFDSVVAVETRAREGSSQREYVFELSCEIKPSRTNAGGSKP